MDKISSPLVSVCIPTYNGEKFISEALSSVFSQTYPNLEIVVSDDASKDRTLAIVEEALKKQTVPWQIIHHQPSGIGANWNNCVKNARGKYIKFLFQDDALESTCVEKMVALAEKDRRIGLVFSKRNFIYGVRSDFFDEWIPKFSDVHLHWKSLVEINSGRRLLADCPDLLSTPMNKVGEPPAVLLRADIFRKTGYFNEALVQVLDYEFWYRVFKYFKIGFIDEYLVNFRLHGNQTTQHNIGNRDDYKIYERVIYKNFFWLLHPSVQKRLIRQFNPIYRIYSEIRRFFKSRRSLPQNGR